MAIQKLSLVLAPDHFLLMPTDTEAAVTASGLHLAVKPEDSSFRKGVVVLMGDTITYNDGDKEAPPIFEVGDTVLCDGYNKEFTWDGNTYLHYDNFSDVFAKVVAPE